MFRYRLSSEECEVLLAFEKCNSLEGLAKNLKRDISAVSRRLQAISGKEPVVEKIGGRWYLTDLGRKVNQWSIESSSQLTQLLARKPLLRFGASRIFLAKVIAIQIEEFASAFSNYKLVCMSIDGNFEVPLLDGTVDIVFACGKPKDHRIASKPLTPEHYVAVAAHQFVERFAPTPKNLYGLPYLEFQNAAGISPFTDIASKVKHIVASFNDPLALHEACQQGIGWTILPQFAIQADSSRFKIISHVKVETAVYGVWWVKNRDSLIASTKLACQWLKGQSL